MCIGWLVGLSASPVLQFVLGIILPLLVTIAGTAAGVIDIRGKRLEFNPTVVMCFVFGIAMGAPAGIFARTNEVFGLNPNFLSQRWAGPELTPNQIKADIFQSLYGHGGLNEIATNADLPKVQQHVLNSHVGGLFGTIQPGEIERLKYADFNEAKNLLRVIDHGKYDSFITTLNSNQIESVKQLLCNSNSMGNSNIHL